MKYLFVFLISAFLSTSLFAQTVNIHSFGEQKGELVNASPIGITDDGVIYCKALTHAIRVGSIFSGNLPELSYRIYNSKTGTIIKEVDYNDSEVIKALKPDYYFVSIDKNKALLIVEKEENNITTFYALKLDDKGNIASKPFEINKGATCNISSVLSSKSRKLADLHWFRDTVNHKYVFVTDYKCEPVKELKDMWRHSLSITTFDDNFQNKEEHKVDVTEPLFSLNRMGYCQGKLYFIGENRGLIDKNRAPIFNYAFVVDANGKLNKIVLPDVYNDQYISKYKIYPENGKLIVYGILNHIEKTKDFPESTRKEYKTSGNSGVFRALIDSSALEHIQTYMYKASSVTMFMEKEDKNDFLDEVSEDGIVFARVGSGNGFNYYAHYRAADGGYYTIMENRIKRTHTTYSSGVPTGSYTSYLYTQPIIIKTTKDGDFQWERHLPISTYTTNFDPGFSVKIIVKGDKLIIIHKTNEDIEGMIKAQGNPDDKDFIHYYKTKGIAATNIDLEGNVKYTAIKLESDKNRYISSIDFADIINNFKAGTNFIVISKGAFKVKKQEVLSIKIQP